MKKFRYRIALPGIILMLFTITGISHAGEQLQPGDQYEIIKPIYLVGVYKPSLGFGTKREADRTYLSSFHHGKRWWMAFETELGEAWMD